MNVSSIVKKKCFSSENVGILKIETFFFSLSLFCLFSISFHFFFTIFLFLFIFSLFFYSFLSLFFRKRKWARPQQISGCSMFSRRLVIWISWPRKCSDLGASRNTLCFAPPQLRDLQTSKRASLARFRIDSDFSVVERKEERKKHTNMCLFFYPFLFHSFIPSLFHSINPLFLSKFLHLFLFCLLNFLFNSSHLSLCMPVCVLYSW